MRILFMHANKIRMEAGPVGKTPSQQRRNERKLRETLGDTLPILNKINSVVNAENSAIALVYVEEGDELLDLTKVKDAILKSREIVGAGSIVISAFGHLSCDNPAPPAIAREMIDKLAGMVYGEYPNVQIAPFGWDKTFDLSMQGLEFELPRHHYNVSHAIFRPISENFWDDIAGKFDVYLLRTNHYDAQWRILQKFQNYLLGNILDLGCGAGRILSYIWSALPIEQWNIYFGVDSSEAMLELATGNNSVNGIAHSHFAKRVKWVQSKIEELRVHFAVDTVLLFNAVSYIEADHVIAKIKQLSPKKLIIADEDPFISEFIELCPPEIRKRLNAKKHPAISEIKQMVGASGFVQIDETRATIDDKHELVGMIFEKNSYPHKNK